MILNSPDKHLTDQEFYTLIKFFDLVIEKKGIDDEETSFRLSDISAGNEEAGDLFNRIFMSGQLLEISIDIGEGKDKQKIEKLKKELSKLPKDTNIVIYCGCCPFKDCPNIRPAFKLLNEMKFTNHKLLNLSHNLKVDWIDKGYPINE